MAARRSQPFLWPSWVSKFITGESHCLWALWFKANYRHDKVPNGFDLTAWQAEHTALVAQRAATLREQGFTVTIEDQNAFSVQTGGVRLAGKADLIARNEQTVIVEDCKTGKPRVSDIAQVQLYLAVLPHVWPQYRALALSGRVQYASHAVPIAASSVDDAFRARVRELIALVRAVKPPERVPSFRECAWCDITDNDCPDRQETSPVEVSADYLFMAKE